MGRSEGLVILEQTRRILNDKGIPDVGLTETDDRSAFSVALDAAKAANPNGGMVDSQTVEGLTESGARTFMRPDGNAGVAVEADGNIVGVFKNPSLKIPFAVQDLILSAVAQGGNHLDCYATYTPRDLRNKYAALGFEPVAWLEFSEEAAPVGWDYDAWGRPDVIMWVHNGDTVEQIVSREEPYRVWTKDDIHGLPKFEDYDEAKAHQKAELEKRKAAQNAGKRLSINYGEYAPTYYSQMERVVQGMKQAKFGASSVVSMLRGRGVKAEEIKWSGVEQWLEGKKSVTKDELLEFIADSELQIEEEELGNPKYTQGELETLHSVEKDLEELTEKAADKWQILFGTEIPAAAFDGETLYGSIGRAIENAPAHPDISEIMEDADRMEEHKRALREMNQILSSIREVESIRDEAVTLAEERSAPKWDRYKLDGGSNYRELQFYLPDSDYTNLAMQSHWPHPRRVDDDLYRRGIHIPILIHEPQTRARCSLAP